MNKNTDNSFEKIDLTGYYRPPIPQAFYNAARNTGKAFQNEQFTSSFYKSESHTKTMTTTLERPKNILKKHECSNEHSIDYIKKTWSQFQSW